VSCRTDTPRGPVWLVPGGLGEKAAKHTARLDLLWPDLDGFVAMHTGTGLTSAWLVRAPRAALEARGLPIGSAAELPVADGTVWPPLDEVVPAAEACVCPVTDPDSFGNRDLVERNDCPVHGAAERAVAEGGGE
jgi:hypothetical protein